MKRIIPLFLIMLLLCSCASTIARPIVSAGVASPSQSKTAAELRPAAQAASSASAQPKPSPEPSPESSPKTRSEPQYELEQVFSKQYVSYEMRQRDMYVFTNTDTRPLSIRIKSFDYETKSGKLIDTATLKGISISYVLPGEKSYIFADNNITDYNADEIKSVLSLAVDFARDDCIRYEVSDLTLSADKHTNRIEAVGRVTNTSSETTDSFYYVRIVVFDKNDTPLDIVEDTLYEDLKPNESISFKASTIYNFITDFDQIARYEVYAFPYRH